MPTLCPAGTFAQMKITACLNEELAINCTSDSNHVWEGTALDCTGVVVASGDDDGNMYPCGSTPIVKVEGGSRLTVTADSSLDGATVVCRTLTETVVNATVEVLGKLACKYFIWVPPKMLCFALHGGSHCPLPPPHIPKT